MPAGELCHAFMRGTARRAAASWAGVLTRPCSLKCLKAGKHSKLSIALFLVFLSLWWM